MINLLKHCLVLGALGTVVSVGSAAAQMHRDDAHSGPTMNYHVIDERLATGGHFVDGGVAAIRDRGVEIVIDLRDQPPTGQKEALARVGIEWINIPVVWDDPRRRDFARFSAEMSKHKDRNVLVQCQANLRASTMTYLYRVTVEKLPADVAEKDLNAVWEPSERWREFMDEILE